MPKSSKPPLPLSQWKHLSPKSNTPYSNMELITPDDNKSRYRSFREIAKSILQWVDKNHENIQPTGSIESLFRITHAKSGRPVVFAAKKPQLSNGGRFYDPVYVSSLSVHIETNQERQVMIDGILKFLDICGIDPDTFRIATFGKVNAKIPDVMPTGMFVHIDRWNDLNPNNPNRPFRTQIITPDEMATKHNNIQHAIKHLIQWVDTNKHYSQIPANKEILITNPENNITKPFSKETPNYDDGKPFRNPVYAPNLDMHFETTHYRSVLIFGILELFHRCDIKFRDFLVRKIP